jgi:putative endonuclease
MRNKDALGRVGEAIAARMLQDAGMQVIESNWRCARGELDIVAREGPILVFCEVKTRSSVTFGDPSEAVGATKAARLRTLGALWLETHPGGGWAEIRFDVVSVLMRPGTRAQVRHLKGVL